MAAPAGVVNGRHQRLRDGPLVPHLWRLGSEGKQGGSEGMKEWGGALHLSQKGDSRRHQQASGAGL